MASLKDKKVSSEVSELSATPTSSGSYDTVAQAEQNALKFMKSIDTNIGGLAAQNVGLLAAGASAVGAKNLIKGLLDDGPEI